MGRTSLRSRAQRASHSAADMIADRQKAIELMNSKLLNKMQQIEKQFSDTRGDNLRFYYQLGETVRDIRNNPEQYSGTDGTSGIKLLERALSTQSRTLRRSASFREAFTPSEFERLVGLENSETHFQLHWGHVNYLLTIEDKEQRWRFAGEACSRMLSPPELHAYMRKRLGRSRGHGRKHKVPETLRAQLRQVESVTVGWNNKQAQVWDGDDVNVISNLMQASPDDVDQDFLDHLTATRDGFLDMAENAAKNAERFNRIIDRCEKIMQRKKTQEAAEANSGKQSRSIDLEGAPRRKAG